MKFFNSLSFKFTMVVIVVLIIVFSLQSVIQVRKEFSFGKEQILLGALSFSSLSVKPLVDNYKLYYDSGFYKFKEISEKIIELDTDLKKVQIISMSGEVLFDSEELQTGKKSSDNGSKLFLDDVLAKKIAGLESFSREIDLEGVTYLEVIQPYVEDWGRHQYSVRYLFSYDSAFLGLKSTILVILLSALLFFLISVLIIFLFSRVIVIRPLNRLMAAISGYARGEAGVEKQILSIRSSDEIGLLAASFNSMVSELSRSKKIIEQRASDLENIVAERTKALQSNVDELEKMGKITVGRELKMVELKKRIGELEKQLKAATARQDGKLDKKQGKKK